MDNRGRALLAKLEGPDRRSIGRSNEVAAEVLRHPDLFVALVEGMLSDDLLVRMRAADAAEKVSVRRPELLAPHKRVILDRVARIEQQEVRWHVAQILPRLPLTSGETRRAVETLLAYLDDKSAIVRTFSMDALAQFAQTDAALRTRVRSLLERLVTTGTAAMKSRGRRLLAQLRADLPV